MLTKLDDSIIAYSLVNAESCDGATVTAGDVEKIIDSHNSSWGINLSGTITVNRLDDDYNWNYGWEEKCAWYESWDGYCTKLLLYWNQTVYGRDCREKWCKRIENRWVGTNDPRPSSTSSVDMGCTIPPPTGRYASLSQKIVFYTINH